jgi:hypothetical protein
MEREAWWLTCPVLRSPHLAGKAMLHRGWTSGQMRPSMRHTSETSGNTAHHTLHSTAHFRDFRYAAHRTLHSTVHKKQRTAQHNTTHTSQHRAARCTHCSTGQHNAYITAQRSMMHTLQHSKPQDNACLGDLQMPGKMPRFVQSRRRAEKQRAKEEQDPVFAKEEQDLISLCQCACQTQLHEPRCLSSAFIFPPKHPCA